MMPIPRSFLLLIGFALVVKPGFAAQEASSTSATSRDQLQRQVEAQLGSSDARTVAWGAYTAGAYHLTNAVPLLQRILESPPAVSRDEHRAFLDVILDSLIQLDAHLPASLLVRYVDERPVQTFALLASATDREQVLLYLLPKTSEFQWYAVANMLMEQKTRAALAAHLLRRLHLHLTLTVSDADPTHFGAGRAVGIAIGDGIGQDPRGYPPHAEYRFENAPRQGVVVIAAGPHPVYYWRRVSADFQYAVSELRIGGPTDADRLAYLHAMLGSANPPIQNVETMTAVRWTTVPALTKRIEELQADTRRTYGFLVNQLNQWYPLPPEVVAMPATIDVELIDERADRSIPLPHVR